MDSLLKKLFRFADPFGGYIPFSVICLLVILAPLLLDNKVLLIGCGMLLANLFQYLKGFVK